jgi:hypothetical protein
MLQVYATNLSLAKTLGVLSFTPLTMLQACAQAVDFKVGHHFGEGQPLETHQASSNPVLHHAAAHSSFRHVHALENSSHHASTTARRVLGPHILFHE